MNLKLLSFYSSGFERIPGHSQFVNFKTMKIGWGPHHIRPMKNFDGTWKLQREDDDWIPMKPELNHMIGLLFEEWKDEHQTA